MTGPAGLERLLRRDRAITLAGLAALCLLAWAYILAGAGLGMSAGDMTRLALFPHREAGGGAMAGMAMPPGTMPPVWNPLTWLLMIAMWWVMMIAMMTPSAAPTILLYAGVHRHAIAERRAAGKLAPTAAFAAGYLLIWLAFSVAATALTWWLERSGLVSAMMMGSRSRWLSALTLLAAGAYQVSPLKYRCLSHCRAPASFLARHWRPGMAGAIRLGVLHGGYCVGCCWLLMALLFVGGVMNLVWIAALAVLVLIEKLLPAGRATAGIAGVVLMLWGAATILVGA